MHAFEFRDVPKKLADLHLAIKATFFRQVADAIFVVERRSAEDAEDSAIRRDNRHQHSNRRALASAVGTEESAQGSLWKFKRDFVNRLHASEAL